MAKTAYVYNTSGKLLNIRSQANKTSAVVITIAEGSSVTVTGDIINGFYPVNCEGKSGYAQADYITFKKESNGKTAWISYAVTSDLDIHRLPAIGKTIRGKIPAGAQLTVFGEKTNGFYRVEYNGVSGYAQAKYIVFSKPTEGKKAWVYNTNGAPLEVHRTSALGNTIRGEIPAKAEVTVTGNKTNGFYKVTYKDIVGYVQAEYITFTKPPEGKSAWSYDKSGNTLKIHRTAALGKTIRGQIPFGEELTVTGDKTNGFYPIEYKGVIGFVSADCITFSKPSNTTINQSLDGARTLAPTSTNFYYYSNKNIYYASENDLAPKLTNNIKGNCTWYAWGRAWELTGKKLPSGFNGNAYTWWNGSVGKFSRGSTPKVGAIAVWKSAMPGSGGCGHVAVVEKIENGKVYISESGYPNTLFKYRQIYSTQYLYGYIYIK